MPAISQPSRAQSSSIIPPPSSNTPYFLWSFPSMRSILIFLFIISIPLTLFLILRRVIRSRSLQSRCHAHARTAPQDWKQVETLESSWPPASFVNMAPESNNLPSPTIRRNSPSADPTPSSPRRTSVPKMKTWPIANGLLRRETMEKVNGCRRHVVVFGKQG